MGWAFLIKSLYGYLGRGWRDRKVCLHPRPCLFAHHAHLESCVLKKLSIKLWDTCEICNVLEREAPLQTPEAWDPNLNGDSLYKVSGGERMLQGAQVHAWTTFEFCCYLFSLWWTWSSERHSDFVNYYHKVKMCQSLIDLEPPRFFPKGSFYRALANGRPELNKSKQSIFHVAPKTTPPMIGSLIIH